MGNGHRAMAYTRLNENLEGEAGKGHSLEESFYEGARVDGEEAPMRDGVVEMVGEVVGEELLGGTELVVGSGSN
jgi:hypothetical protein